MFSWAIPIFLQQINLKKVNITRLLGQESLNFIGLCRNNKENRQNLLNWSNDLNQLTKDNKQKLFCWSTFDFGKT